VLVLAGLFAVVSWFGLWRVVADPVRIVVLAGFAVAAVLFAIRAVRLRAPARAAALLRVERATGMLHRPATAFTDTIAVGANDPAAQALWFAHRERLLAALDTLKAGLPSPGLARRDPWAIRFLAILLFRRRFIYAGPELDKLAEAFAAASQWQPASPGSMPGDAARLYLAAADLPHRRAPRSLPAPNTPCRGQRRHGPTGRQRPRGGERRRGRRDAGTRSPAGRRPCHGRGASRSSAGRTRQGGRRRGAEGRSRGDGVALCGRAPTMRPRSPSSRRRRR
jgi:hypothetical protein